MITDTDQHIKQYCDRLRYKTMVPQFDMTPSDPKLQIPYCLTVPSWRDWIMNVPYIMFNHYGNGKYDTLTHLIDTAHTYYMSGPYISGIRFHDGILNIIVFNKTIYDSQSLPTYYRYESVNVNFVVCDRYLRDSGYRDKYAIKQINKFTEIHELCFSPDVPSKEVVKSIHKYMKEHSDEFIFQHYEEQW